MTETNKHFNVCLAQNTQIPKEERVQLKGKASGHRHSCEARTKLSGQECSVWTESAPEKSCFVSSLNKAWGGEVTVKKSSPSNICGSSGARSCFPSNINHFTVSVGLSGQISWDKEILDPPHLSRLRTPRHSWHGRAGV